MRYNMPDEILMKILEYSKNKNLILTNKNFHNFILNQRNIFLKELDTKPILIKYTLFRWKQRFCENNQYRPSIYGEPEKIFKIDRNNAGLKIGNICNNQIEYSKDLENELVPVSLIKENSSSNTYAGTVLYWTLRETKSDNIELIKRYNTLF